MNGVITLVESCATRSHLQLVARALPTYLHKTLIGHGSQSQRTQSLLTYIQFALAAVFDASFTQAWSYSAFERYRDNNYIGLTKSRRTYSPGQFCPGFVQRVVEAFLGMTGCGLEVGGPTIYCLESTTAREFVFYPQ